MDEVIACASPDGTRAPTSRAG